MNKKYVSSLIILLSYLCINIPVAYCDELVLKNGTIIDCKILDIKANESYRILFKDGSVVTYPADQVSSVKITDTQKEKKGESPSVKTEPEPAKRIDSYQSISPQTPYTSQRSERMVKFLASFSLVISPDYKDMIDDAYAEADTTGGYGWLGLDLGASFKVNDNLSISPTCGILFNYISIQTDYYYNSEYMYTDDTNSYSNYIILPRIAARYKFTVSPPSPYVCLELNYNEPKTGSDRFEFESGGIGYGALMGIAPVGNMILEVGYLYVPVEWGFKTNYGIINQDTKNLGGGFIFRIGAAF